MSSILKALKKLEEEKSARQGQRVDITRDIFGAAQQPTRGVRWPLVAAGVAGIVALGAAAYLFIARPGSTPTPPQSAPAETRRDTAPSPPSPAAAPVETIPQPRQEASRETPKPVTSTVAPARTTRSDVARTREPLTTPIRSNQVSAPPRPAAPSPVPVISANRPALGNLPPSPQTAKPAVPGAVALPRLTVSGIAYNKEPADRLAVINGVPTGEGKTVSGVTVEEIMADRVRFSHGQQSFEVPVGRSNQ